MLMNTKKIGKIKLMAFADCIYFGHSNIPLNHIFCRTLSDNSLTLNFVSFLSYCYFKYKLNFFITSLK